MAFTPEEARQRKNERQRKYSKDTNFKAVKQYRANHRGKTKQIYLALPAEKAEQYKQKCEKEGITQTAILLKAIDEFLND